MPPSKKPCGPAEVRNPFTRRCLKVGGRAFQAIVAGSLASPKKRAPNGFALFVREFAGNEQPVQTAAAEWRVMDPRDKVQWAAHAKDQAAAWSPKKATAAMKKPCASPTAVRNPFTNRCIEDGSRTFKTLTGAIKPKAPKRKTAKSPPRASKSKA
jgi:hypothetical protein